MAKPNIPPPNVPLAMPQGLAAQDWYRFFMDLARLQVPEVVTIDTTAFTVADAYNGQIARMTAAGAKTVTIPADFSPAGGAFMMGFAQDSATQITFALADGTETLKSSGSLLSSYGQHSAVFLMWFGPGVWWLFGDLG